MKLRKAFAGTAAAAVAVSALAVSAGASLLIVDNAPSHLSSGSGMWMAKVYCPSENIDFGVDYASIKTVKFQITTDDTDFFEGMFGGALVMSCGPASLCPEDHNWIQKSFWGCIDEENGFETQDAAADLLAETLGDYTYQLTLNVDASNCLYAVDSPDAYAQIALMEWGQDMSQIVVKGMQCYDEAGNVVIAFDGEGNLVYGAVYPGMKDALTLLAKWYKDGLIDPEFITGENQGGYWALSVPFENGQIGFSSSGAYYHLAPDFDGPKDEETGKGGAFKYGRTMRTFAETTGYDKMVIGYNPTGPDGRQGGESWGLTTSEAIVFSYKLDDQPAKLARILEIMNVIGSDLETYLKVRLWDTDLSNYEYDSLLGYVKKEGYEKPETFGAHGNMFNTLQNPYFAEKLSPATIEWALTLPQFSTGGYSNTMLPITTASMPQYWTSMDTLRQTTYIQIITGEKPVDAFDEFVQQWNAMGGEKITAEANEWYHAK